MDDGWQVLCAPQASHQPSLKYTRHVDGDLIQNDASLANTLVCEIDWR